MNYIISRKNKKNNLNFFVKDGIIKYQVTFEPKIKCLCNSKKTLCDHILFILYNEFKLSDFVVKYFHHIYYDFIKNSKNINQLNDILESKLLEKFNNDNCGFCLNKLSDKKYNYQLSQCSNCHNITHQKCMNLWNKGCIICRSHSIFFN